MIMLLALLLALQTFVEAEVFVKIEGQLMYAKEKVYAVRSGDKVYILSREDLKPEDKKILDGKAAFKGERIEINPPIKALLRTKRIESKR